MTFRLYFFIKNQLGTILFSLFLIMIFQQSNGQSADITLNNPITTATTITATHSITLNAGFSANGANGPVILQITEPSVQNCVPLAAAPSLNQNYVMTLIPRVALSDVTQLASKNACEMMQNIQYLDGLGRLSQTVQVKGNSNADKDLVSLTEYDVFGRESLKFLPYASTSADGSFKIFTGLNDAWNYYSNPPAGVATNYYPASETIFESSPLNRPIEQGFPGEAFQPIVRATDDGGHTIKTDYGYNTESGDRTVRMYFAAPGLGFERILTSNNNYPANQLYLTIIKDENWLNGKAGTTEEYKDKLDRVVLKRVWQNESVQLSTYYVYDDMGNLSFVLPPGTNADIGTPSTTVLNSLCYQYQYDERKRLIKKKLPGIAWQNFVYNKLDQIVATQDGLQHDNNQWIITKYDAQGRIIITGIWNNGMSQEDLKAQIYAQTTQWETKDNSQANGYTTINTYPTNLNTILTVNYYDDYDIGTLPYDHRLENSQRTSGLLTASKVNILGTSDMLWTVHYYDDKGHNIKTFQQHYLNGVANPNNYDEVSSTYDFTNEVTNTKRKHYTNNSGTPNLALTIANAYEYDHMGRKRRTWERINNSSDSVLLSQTDYNEIGQLLTKHLHSANHGGSFLQDINYTYNERGWLTKSKAPFFEEQLQYNQVDNISGITPAAQYNGNIASQSWGNNAIGENHDSYTYSYDKLNRLTEGISTTSNNESGITYDLMGNIKSLVRSGNSSASLDYDGYNGNQLISVKNSGSVFRTYGSYDSNGNAPSDGQGHAINYNILNQPASIPSLNITYTYDATGRKLRKISGGTVTEYINGIQYNGNTIDFVQTEEGRVLNLTGTPNFEYTLSDHLGNSRVNFDSSNGVVQSNDYYPFGMNIVGSSTPSSPNKYLYNKKELQEELGQYDYGARFYDPVIGRWTTVDPSSEEGDQESLTPYQYGLNNPVKNTDPDGRCPSCLIGALVGAGLEYAVEVGTNIVHDGHFSTSAFTNVKAGKILLAGAAGAIGGGIGSGAARLGGLAANLVENAGAKVAIKAAVNITGDVVSSIAGNAVQGNKITAGSIAADVAGGIIGRGISNHTSANLKNSPEGQALAKQAAKAERKAIGGRIGGNKVATAKAMAQKLENFGSTSAGIAGTVGYGLGSKVVGLITNPPPPPATKKQQ